MEHRRNLKQVGRCFADRELYDEGYLPQDIFEEPVLELPELFDPEKRVHAGWMVCPICVQQIQVDRRDPVCPYCEGGHADYSSAVLVRQAA